jgi:hypothetical protein
MSSLLGPPTTVAEDEDSVVGDLPFQDENRPNWGEYRSRRRANDTAVMVELDDFASAPPVARVIHEFNQELDTLVRSFDSFFSRKKDRRPLESTSGNTLPYPLSVASTAKKGTPNRQREAPPSSVDYNSPLKSSFHSTPARRFGSGSVTPSEPPPAPVETPGFGFPTPNRHRSRRGATTTPAAPRVDTSYTSTYTRQEPSPATRQNPRETETADDEEFEDLHRIIREQQNRIQDLEIENEILRKKLMLQQPPIIQRIHRSSPLEEEEERPAPTSRFDPEVERRREDHHHSNHRSEFSGIREEPDGRHNPSMASSPRGPAPSPYRTQASYVSSTPSRRVDLLPPRHIQTMEDPMEGFTPGTLFVAELATLMKIENSHYVPLSVILDKHWDRLKHHFRT